MIGRTNLLTFLTVIIILWVTPALADIYTVQSGDTLSALLSEYYTPGEITDASREIRGQVPGFVLKVGMRIEQSLDSFAIQISQDKEARIFREDGNARVVVMSYEEEILPTVLTGTIKTTLFDSVMTIGESPELAASLARIFEWEIDFFRDFRPGDTFTVLVEKKFVKNSYVGYGRILAAKFTVRGKTFKAFLYNDGERFAYYNEDAKALERGFLRVPLSYARITSRYSGGRMHPVLKTVRPHYGVDYGAPKGTPVMVTASGTVKRAGYTKSNGNYIEVTHSNGYSTFYLHLNGFRKGLKSGIKVTQGETIGYVGSTGYSTGPHLDYRIKRNGKWLNPLNFIAESPRMNEERMVEFFANAKWQDRLMEIQPEYVGLQRLVYF